MVEEGDLLGVEAVAGVDREQNTDLGFVVVKALGLRQQVTSTLTSTLTQPFVSADMEAEGTRKLATGGLPRLSY